MNKPVQSLLFILALCMPISTYSMPYIGTIDLNSSVDLPGIYYDGYRICTERSKQAFKTIASFEIEESRNIDTINLLIINGPVKVATTCTNGSKSIPSCLVVPTTTTYSFYQLTKKIVANIDEDGKREEQLTWDIQESQLDSSRQLPEDHTLILLFDPALIEKIENTTWDIEDNAIKLPTIVVKNSAEDVQSMAIRLKLASIEMNAFHEPMDLDINVRHRQQNLTVTKAISKQWH